MIPSIDEMIDNVCKEILAESKNKHNWKKNNEPDTVQVITFDKNSSLYQNESRQKEEE